jgi:hypothetical protein
MRRGGIIVSLSGRQHSSYLDGELGWMALKSGARFTSCRARLGCAAFLIVMGHVSTIFVIDLPWKLWSSGIGPVKM